MHPYFNILSHQIPAYGTMMMLGLVIAGALGLKRVRRAGFRWEDALVLLMCGFAFALLGAAGLFIVVTYSWKEILDMLRSGELFTGERIGLVFYGGLLGSIPGVLLGKGLTGAKLADYVPPMVPCIPLGHAFGRIGCLLAGCCYGIPVDGFPGIVYPVGTPGVPENARLFPVQALESLTLMVIFGILMKSSKRLPAGKITGLYLVLYAVCRFALEGLRYDSVRGSWGGLSTSQWISMGLLAAGMALWIAARKGEAE